MNQLHIYFVALLSVLGGLGCQEFEDRPPGANAPVSVEQSVDAGSKVLERFGERLPPRPSDHPVKVYHLKLPTEAFTELGRVRAVGNVIANESKLRALLMAHLKTAARELGGDGIAGLNEYSRTRVVGAEWTVAHETRVLTAVVIRFD